MNRSSLFALLVAATITTVLALSAKPLPRITKRSVGHVANSIPMPPGGALYHEAFITTGTPIGRWWRVSHTAIAVTMFECGAFQFERGNKATLAGYKVVDQQGQIVRGAAVSGLPPFAQMGNGDRLEPLPIGFIVHAAVPAPGKYCVWALYGEGAPPNSDWSRAPGGCYRGCFTD